MGMNPAVVLLSGGQDSTTALFWARERYKCLAVSFDYGQRHKAELVAAAKIATIAQIQRVVLPVPALHELGDSALVSDAPIQGEGGRVDQAMPQGLPTSFVPGRNLILLATAAALAVKIGAKTLVTGVCQTDFSGYPDCRRTFIDAMEQAVSLAMPSSAGPITIETPLMHLTKAETVQMAAGFGAVCWAALAESITCYNGQRPGCGACPACELRAKGFAEAGEYDPARGE